MYSITGGISTSGAISAIAGTSTTAWAVNIATGGRSPNGVRPTSIS